MIEGCTSKQWEEIQEHYLLTIGSRASPKRWTSSLIPKMWDVAWDQWQHRNDAVHSGQQAQRVSEEVNDRIRDEWRQGTRGLDLNTRALFRATTFERLLERTIQHRRSWLGSVTLGRANPQQPTRQQRQRQETSRMRHLMRNFLLTGAPQVTEALVERVSQNRERRLSTISQPPPRRRQHQEMTRMRQCLRNFFRPEGPQQQQQQRRPLQRAQQQQREQQQA